MGAGRWTAVFLARPSGQARNAYYDRAVWRGAIVRTWLTPSLTNVGSSTRAKSRPTGGQPKGTSQARVVTSEQGLLMYALQTASYPAPHAGLQPNGHPAGATFEKPARAVPEGNGPKPSPEVSTLAEPSRFGCPQGRRVKSRSPGSARSLAATPAREGLIARKLREAQGEGPGWPRVLDLSDLAQAPSSSELACLLEALPRLEAEGASLALSGLRADVRRVMEITHLDRLFAIVP